MNKNIRGERTCHVTQIWAHGYCKMATGLSGDLNGIYGVLKTVAFDREQRRLKMKIVTWKKLHYQIHDSGLFSLLARMGIKC